MKGIGKLKPSVGIHIATELCVLTIRSPGHKAMASSIWFANFHGVKLPLWPIPSHPPNTSKLDWKESCTVSWVPANHCSQGTFLAPWGKSLGLLSLIHPSLFIFPVTSYHSPWAYCIVSTSFFFSRLQLFTLSFIYSLSYCSRGGWCFAYIPSAHPRGHLQCSFTGAVWSVPPQRLPPPTPKPHCWGLSQEAWICSALGLGHGGSPFEWILCHLAIFNLGWKLVDTTTSVGNLWSVFSIVFQRLPFGIESPLPINIHSGRPSTMSHHCASWHRLSSKLCEPNFLSQDLLWGNATETVIKPWPRAYYFSGTAVCSRIALLKGIVPPDPPYLIPLSFKLFTRSSPQPSLNKLSYCVKRKSSLATLSRVGFLTSAPPRLAPLLPVFVCLFVFMWADVLKSVIFGIM